jgi:ABC-type glycerol-3-phosphate transport system substrate-binding protein
MKTALCLIIIALGIMALIGGCASVSYESPDGTKVSYTRFLTNADNIKAKVGDSSVEANGVKLDWATIQYLMGLGAQVAK